MIKINDIRNAVNSVAKKYGIKSATLFGSFAKGTESEDSDVDLVVDTGLAGFKFMAMYCDIQDLLGGVKLDLYDKYEIIVGSKLYTEIEETGVSLLG